MDAVRQLAQVGEHLARLVLELDQLERPQLVALEPLSGQPEAGDERDDALLDAVVQVALDASTLLVLRGDEPDARGAELVELLVEAGGEPHVGDGRRRLPGHRARGGRARRRRTHPACAGPARGGRGARRRGRGPGWPRHPRRRPRRRPARTATSPSAPSTLTRTHEASRPRRTPSASRASTSSSSMACSRRAPSSLSSARWWSRSPSTARRIARCSQPRRGSSATAAIAVSRTALTGSSRSKKEERRRRDRDPVEHGDEGRRRPHDERARSASATSNAPYRRMPWMPGRGQGEQAQQHRGLHHHAERCPRGRCRASRVHSPQRQLPKTKSTVQAMTRTRARVRSSPRKARLIRTSMRERGRKQRADDERRPGAPPTPAPARPRGSRSRR